MSPVRLVVSLLLDPNKLKTSQVSFGKNDLRGRFFPQFFKKRSKHLLKAAKIDPPPPKKNEARSNLEFLGFFSRVIKAANEIIF